jgi:hypothetical protein
MWIIAIVLAAIGVGMAIGARSIPALWRWYAWRLYLGLVILAALLWLISPSYISHTAGA